MTSIRNGRKLAHKPPVSGLRDTSLTITWNTVHLFALVTTCLWQLIRPFQFIAEWDYNGLTEI